MRSALPREAPSTLPGRSTLRSTTANSATSGSISSGRLSAGCRGSPLDGVRSRPRARARDDPRHGRRPAVRGNAAGRWGSAALGESSASHGARPWGRALLHCPLRTRPRVARSARATSVACAFVCPDPPSAARAPAASTASSIVGDECSSRTRSSHRAATGAGCAEPSRRSALSTRAPRADLRGRARVQSFRRRGGCRARRLAGTWPLGDPARATCLSGAGGRGSVCAARTSRRPSARRGPPAPLELRRVRCAHVPDEPEPLEPTDHPPRDVELAAQQAVPCGGGERVVVVVPALAEDEQRHDPVVAGLVARAEVLAAEHVADRVHGEGRVLVEEDAKQAAPDHRLDAALPGAADRGSRPRTGCRA